MEKTIFILQIASTLFLTGVIWVIQIVQYPFFAYVGAENFTKYHDDYRFWITPIVAPAMIIELLTAIFLLFYPPENINLKLIWLGLVLTLLVWASTFFVQVPLHEKLAHGFNSQTLTALVDTNWIRTVCWSLRGGLVLYFVWKVIRF
ncbi:MAG TPA: hypothetical protein VNB22_09355 [Pyrinomonadaceae bacterium]|jgi:hypothetical protein|nr:hypothetical protein [Pyrinomonadaceae bacterium]